MLYFCAQVNNNQNDVPVSSNPGECEDARHDGDPLDVVGELTHHLPERPLVSKMEPQLKRHVQAERTKKIYISERLLRRVTHHLPERPLVSKMEPQLKRHVQAERTKKIYISERLLRRVTHHIP